MNPLLTIITPVFNSAKLLQSTIDSIKNQTYKNVEYIIVDGGSTDGTLDIINDNSQMVSVLISEKDSGMYDALSKGLKVAKGDFICYLNAGDILYPDAASKVVKFLSENKLDWVTGYISECNESNEITKIDLPFRYKTHLIQRGMYGKYLPYIQQESTFWSKKLIDTIDFDKLRSLRLAGDYYLWYCFSKESKLEILKTPLGAFKKHEGQLSEDLHRYWKEVGEFTEPSNLFNKFEVLLEGLYWLLDVRVREKLVSTNWRFDHAKHQWMKK
ncbi:glycosyltransferase family 2 protein [Rheinheimera soli]|uniref:Glycosyltransferase involved in cell wall biosynthesis n=1 Tax=Rheinheimera soli TaxID=443616 RepID=A0ABU1VU80_9GAMM|nr:glycosyltransferase family 2 protein [Rheinheimera soli]MDR7119278.1 glycosyltransferase involved in cell wall biosynthesis [Rheinheimera soli]